MINFDLWSETFIFAAVYFVIIIVPCILVALLGRKLINQIGTYPSKTPIFQIGVIWQLVVIEVFTFGLLIGFFQFFTGE